MTPTPRQRLKATAIAVAAITLIIVLVTWVIAVLFEATKWGGWAVFAWAVLVASGALAGVAAAARAGLTRKPPSDSDPT